MEKYVGTWENLEQLIRSKRGLTVVVLTSPECNVCRRLKQQFPPILKENPDVNFIEVEYKEENLSVFQHLNISNIPHLFYYSKSQKDGPLNEVAHLIGFNPQDIRMKIQQFI